MGPLNIVGVVGAALEQTGISFAFVVVVLLYFVFLLVLKFGATQRELEVRFKSIGMCAQAKYPVC